ncbi:mucin-13b isoform X2 [Sparus aurata]|uniref:Mucin 13b, cell surface associated n=1 Tax=Sparus aurata TaxID=8175 RepID=A0A671UPJ9_SPAAU|nr:mucin-13-like isoform X2 [Sparus aurata]
MAQKFKLLFLLSLVVACLVIPDNPVAAATIDAPVTTDPSTTNLPVSTKPSATSEPSVSTKPSATSEPSVSTKPSATSEPSVSTKPSATSEPSVSTKPSATSEPSVSTKPTATSDPSVSTKPSVTVDPSVSATPTSSEVTDAETSAPSLTTPNPDSCDSNPCGPGSTCEARAYPNYVCLCQAGDIYNHVSNSCQNAKVFPGNLFAPELPYEPEMSDPKSTEFLEAAEKIMSQLQEVFKANTTYTGSTVLKLEPFTTARVWSREGNPHIKATVEISFTATADVTTDGVLEEIKSYVDTCSVNCLLNGATFISETLCAKNACDAATTRCLSTDGSFKCDCRESYVPTAFSDRMCIACPSGQGVDKGKCVKCSFGRSGLNCSESWQLTLVIVASVLGALLLITLIILPIVALKPSKKKSPKKNKNADIREPYVSPIPAKAPLVNDSFANSQAASASRSDNAFANAGVPRIPRATTTSSWDRGNLEMTPSNSRQNLVPGGRNARLYEDDDDMAPYSQSQPQSNLYAQVRPQSNLYAQARPQSNPYAQNQSQVNPYASNQGHANPYYMQDDGRRFN